MGQTYNPIGALNAPRGTYTLKIGPVSRDFTVARGQVAYTGDLNAELDIEARHLVRSVRGDTIPIIAQITGTLYQPKLSLDQQRAAADLRDRPGLLHDHRLSGDEATLVGQGGALQTGLAYFSSALSSELERALIQDLGVPIDLIEIRPGVSASPAGGATLNQLAAGWQIGQQDLPHLQRRLLPRLQPDHLQESRREPRVPVQPRVETAGHGRAHHPVLQQLRDGEPAREHHPYQIGFDILWEREF